MVHARANPCGRVTLFVYGSLPRAAEAAEMIYNLHMRNELESRETPQGSVLLVTNPLGTHGDGDHASGDF